MACRKLAGRALLATLALGGMFIASPCEGAVECVATYSLTVQCDWSQAHHENWAEQFDTVSNPHFSHLGGATHNSSVTIWQPGGLSSPGFIHMQEEGWIDNPNLSSGDFKSEFDVYAAFGQAQFFLNYPQHFAAGSSTVLSFDVSETHPLVTLFSMLGPTPDWFIGVSGLNMRDGNGWIDTITVDLFTYDGGTRTRDESFALHGTLENPQRAIELIKDTPDVQDPDRTALNSSRIGRFIFQLQNVTGCTDNTVTWTGGGGDSSWHTPANWSGGFVPATTNDVRIGVEANPVITYSTGNITIRSLQCDETFILSGGMLRLTAGTSAFNGSLTLSGGTLQATGSGVEVNAAGATSHSGSSVFVSDGARLWLTNQTTMAFTNSSVTLQAQGADSAIYLPNVTNSIISTDGALFLRAMEGGLIDLQNLESISGGALYASSRAAGSVVDLSQLSVLISRGDGSRLIEISEGSILLNDTAFLLANVALELSTNNTSILDPMLVATEDLVLHGRTGRAYRVEVRDSTGVGGRWQLHRRVPLTNSFQVIDVIPATNLDFRLTELFANPAELELHWSDPLSTQLIIFGLTGKTYRIESTSDLRDGEPWESGIAITLTNSFRILPIAPGSQSMRFFKAREEQ